MVLLVLLARQTGIQWLQIPSYGKKKKRSPQLVTLCHDRQYRFPFVVEPTQKVTSYTLPIGETIC